MRITCSLDVACVMDCAGNSGARNLYVIGAMGYNGRLNKFPGASPGGMVLVPCQKGEPELRNEVLRGVVIRQRKAWRPPFSAGRAGMELLMPRQVIEDKDNWLWSCSEIPETPYKRCLESGHLNKHAFGDDVDPNNKKCA